MYLKRVVVSAFLTAVVAIPNVPAPKGTNDGFTGLALCSGNPDIHLRSINAHDFKFYINKESGVFCPADHKKIDCSHYKGNLTVFGMSNGPDHELFLGVEAPNHQVVYVADDGALAFQAARSAMPLGLYTGPSSLLKGFSLKEKDGQGELKFESMGFLACSTGEGHVYQVFVAGLDQHPDHTDCVGIVFKTSEYNGKDHVYQYV